MDLLVVNRFYAAVRLQKLLFGVTTCCLLRISLFWEKPFASISSIEDNASTNQPTNKKTTRFKFFCQLQAPQLGIFFILYALIP